MIRRTKMMKNNITLEQYIEIVEKAKSAALYDMDSFDIFELHDPDKPVFSALGVKLCCRDDEDCFWVIEYDNYQLFLRFKPDLMNYIRKESKSLLEDDEPSGESAKDRLYWEVTKYTKIGDNMCRMYEAYFSLNCELLGVSNCCNYYSDILYNRKYDIRLSDAQYFLIDSAQQLNDPLNVELPYQPGDILYIDARPFGKPLYAVYCAETDGDRNYFEWTLQEYGYYKRSHICLYMSEDCNGSQFDNLADCMFTDYIAFPYASLDRVKVVNTCDNPIFLKASKMLKTNPNVFYHWREIEQAHIHEEGGLEQWIFND